MKFYSISSGSEGNCLFVGAREGRLLIDAGISGKRIEEGLNGIGVNPADLDGIFLTHEHLDHIKGVGVMARRYGLPIYGTVETLHAMLKSKNIGRIQGEQLHLVKPDQSLQIKDIKINPFSVCHDAGNPVAYTLESGEQKIGIATDLGCFDDYTVQNLKDSNLLFLEANHDINMLQVGAYPYLLKQRILGDKGHLSNASSAKLLRKLLNQKLRYVILAHLSKENNYPELAYETVKCDLAEHGIACHGNFLSVANYGRPSPMVEI